MTKEDLEIYNNYFVKGNSIFEDSKLYNSIKRTVDKYYYSNPYGSTFNLDDYIMEIYRYAASLSNKGRLQMEKITVEEVSAPVVIEKDENSYTFEDKVINEMAFYNVLSGLSLSWDMELMKNEYFIKKMTIQEISKKYGVEEKYIKKRIDSLTEMVSELMPDVKRSKK